MKKNKILILLLCIVMLAQTLQLPVQATETEEEEQTTAQTSGYGNITVTSGCRTIEAMAPLSGSDKILETAQSAFIYESTTDTVIYSYNPDLRVYPGVLSKMVTALIAIEEGNLDDTIIISTTFGSLPIGARNANLKYGEEVTLRDLIYMMMLEAANDAALVIADYVARNEANFVQLMNDRIKQMGCTNTNLVDCHGLSTENQYTTARDMAKIVLACTQNAEFCEIFSATSYTVPATNKSKARDLRSLNYLIEQTIVPKFNYAGVTGGMPGYGTTAGASIVCTAEKNDMKLVYVVMGATRTYSDSGVATYYGNFEEVIDLLEYTFDGFKISRLVYDGQALKQFQVSNGEQDVVGLVREDLDTVLPSGTKMANVIEKYTLANGSISAPIAAGDKIATVQLWYGASCLAEIPLYAACDIRSYDNTGLSIASASRDDSNIGDFLAFIGVLCLAAVVVIAVYLVYNAYRRAQIRARRRRRRASRRRSR